MVAQVLNEIIDSAEGLVEKFDKNYYSVLENTELTI